MENVLGRTSIEILEYRRRMFAEESGQPSQIQGHDHLCQCTTTSIGRTTRTQTYAFQTQCVLLRSPKPSNQDDGHLSALKTKTSGTETWSNNHLAKWNSTAEIMMQEFAESRHPGVLVLVSVIKRRAQVKEVDDLRPITPQTEVPRRC